MGECSGLSQHFVRELGETYKHRSVIWCVLCGCVVFKLGGYVLPFLDLTWLMSVFMCLCFLFLCVCVLLLCFLPGH